MIVLTALLASWVVDSVQGSRVAYVAVKADKDSYAMGEDVTFSLVPLTENVQFTVSGERDGSGVYIVRLADGIDPGTFLDDNEALYNLSSRVHSGNVPVIPIPVYNSTGEPLRLSWNGTIPQYDIEKGGQVWNRATAGYYALYPEYRWEYGHVTKFMLDRASIFYMDGLRVSQDVSLHGSMFTVRTEISLPSDAGPMTGLFTTIVPNHSVPYNSTTVYHNETLDLRPGETSTVTMTYPAMDPSYGPATTSMSAYFIAGETTYAFGFWSAFSYHGNQPQPEVYYVQY